MPNMNNLEIIGHLGSDPEMRFTPNGKPVTSFTVADNYRYTTADGEKREDTQWFRIATWGSLAERCNQSLRRGNLIFVSGRVSLHRWKGEDGLEKSWMGLNARTVVFLTKNPDAKEPEYLEDIAGQDELELE